MRTQTAGLRRWQWLVWAAAAVLSLTGLARADDRERPWRAGTARENITPDELMWMSGYGGRDHIAEGKRTDLWAKALVLEDPAGTQLALVTVDLVGIDRELSSYVCTALADLHRLPRSQVAIACSHTHTGPVVGHNLGAMYFLSPPQQAQVQRYTAELTQKLIRLVGRARAELQPCMLHWGGGTATFAVNRRNNPEDKVPELREQGQLRGPVDHDVPVLRVTDLQGQLRAVVFGYACHATVLGFYEWSGDYPGFAQIELEARHPNCQAMFWAGCGADQNPLPRRTVELAQEYGGQLADSVDEALAGPLLPIAGNVMAQYQEIDLDFAALPTREELVAQAGSSDRFVASRGQRLLAQVDGGQPLAASYRYPVQSWRMGDGPNWVLLGGEVVVDFALRLKREHGPQRTWVAGYANDVMAYIPSRRVLEEGGYEGGGAMVYYGLPSPWAESVEERIVAEVGRQLKGIPPQK